MLCYISGPVSNVKNFKVGFFQARKGAEAKGYDTLSILDCDFLEKNSFKWSDCMKICLAMLEKCDCVVLLNGWKTSVGATIEKAWAEKLGLPVYYSVLDLPPV